MGAITWQNIGSPDLSGVGKTLQGAGTSFSRSTSALDDILKKHTKIREENWDAKAKINTQNILKERQNITDLGEARKAIDAGPADEFGVQYNASALSTGSDTILDKLRTRARDTASMAGRAAAEAEQSPANGQEAFLTSMLNSGASEETAQNALKDFSTGGLSQLTTKWDEEQQGLVDESVQTYRTDGSVSQADAEQGLYQKLTDRKVNPVRKAAAIQSFRTNIEAGTTLTSLETAEVADKVWEAREAADRSLGEVSATKAQYQQALTELAPMPPGLIKQADQMWNEGKLADGNPVDAAMALVGSGGGLDWFKFMGPEFGSDAKNIMYKALKEVKDKGVADPKDQYRLLLGTFADFGQRYKDQSVAGSGQGVSTSFIQTMSEMAEAMVEYKKTEDDYKKLVTLEELTATENARNLARFESSLVSHARRKKVTPNATSNIAALRDNFKSKMSVNTIDEEGNAVTVNPWETQLFNRASKYAANKTRKLEDSQKIESDLKNVPLARQEAFSERQSVDMMKPGTKRKSPVDDFKKWLSGDN